MVYYLGRSKRIFWSSGNSKCCPIVTNKGRKRHSSWVCTLLTYICELIIFPAKIYLFKVNNETLGESVKHIQSFFFNSFSLSFYKKPTIKTYN